MPLLATDFMAVLNRAGGPLAGLADAPAAAYLALSAFGYSAASPSSLADADLATVKATDLPGLIDVGTWRMLESILDNLSEGELRAAGVDDKVGDVAARLRARTDRLYARIRAAYGVGLPELKAGVLDIGGIQLDEPGARNY
jgi:hypothetical protein